MSNSFELFLVWKPITSSVANWKRNMLIVLTQPTTVHSLYRYSSCAENMILQLSWGKCKTGKKTYSCLLEILILKQQKCCRNRVTQAIIFRAFSGHKISRSDSVWKYFSIGSLIFEMRQSNSTQIAKFMGPTWGPPGSCRPQMGPILAPWTLLSGYLTSTAVFPSLIWWDLYSQSRP